MRGRAVERSGRRFVEWIEPVEHVEDAVDLIEACFEHEAPRLLLDARMLPEAFFDLRSRFAGEFIQKLQTYGLRLALVLPDDESHGERFREFVREARRGRGFRTFGTRDEAEGWLLS
jgi:hypothetical protein